MKINDLGPEELDRLLANVGESGLDKEKSLRILKRIDLKSGLGTAGGRLPVRRLPRKAWFAIAACALLLIGLCVGTCVYAEAAEFNRALLYFEENGLSTEGLSRAEIKAMYRSFLSETAEYDEKTGELMQTAEAMEAAGIGFPAETGSPTEDEIKAGEIKYAESGRPSACFTEWDETEDGFVVTGHDEKGRVIWSDSVAGMQLCWPEYVDGGIVLVGTELSSGAPIVVKYSSDGEQLWSCTLGSDEIWAVAGEPGGGLTVFSSLIDYDNDSDHKLIVSRIGAGGELVGSVENHTPFPMRIGETERFGKGWAAIGYNENFDAFDETCLVLIDGEGRIAKQFTVSSDGEKYDYLHLAVSGGKLYVSAQISRYELIGSHYGAGSPTMPDGEYLDLVRNAFSAVLLVFDGPESSPQVFYEVDGACGYDVGITADGLLEWDVRSFVSAKYDRRYGKNGVRYINAKVKLYKYLFNADGGFVERTDSGEITVY